MPGEKATEETGFKWINIFKMFKFIINLEIRIGRALVHIP